MGAACAAELAPRADLILTDLDATRLEETAASLPRPDGRMPTLVACDLSQPQGREKLQGAVHAKNGLHWLVHTAGLSPAMAPWSDVLEVDLEATAALLDTLGKEMHRGGAAVCFASVAGHMGADNTEIDQVLDDPLAEDLPGRLRAALGEEPPSGLAYLYAKRGVIRLCERLAIPWGARGLRVVSLSPGLMDTAMGRFELENTPGKEPLIARIPLERDLQAGQSRLPGRAEDIAQAVGFLCSDAASFITGCDLRIDGGLIAALGS